MAVALTESAGHLATCRQAFRNVLSSRRSRLETDSIIDRGSNPLLTAEIAFSGLNRNVTQEELNLFQLAPSGVAEPSTSSAQVAEVQTTFQKKTQRH
jgi:hypothetical protein